MPSGGGFWIDYLQPAANGLELKLAKVPATGGALKKVSTIAAGTALDAAYPFRPYMAAYGQGKLLLGWKASGQLKLAVADAGTGELIEGPISTTLKIDNFQDMVTASNGDVLWAYSSGGGNVLVNRVAACSLAR